MSTPEIPPPVVPAPIPQPPNTFWRGPNGIRAGWRVLIFLAIVAGISLTLIVGIFIVSRGRIQAGVSGLTPLGVGLSEAAIFFVTAIAALIMSVIEHRSWGQYGLPARHAFRGDFWIGTVVGFLAISTCLLAIFAFHGFHLAGLNTHGDMIVKATVAWGVAFIMVGLAEEFSFRGYLQYTLAMGMGYWPAAILLSVLFGLAHARNPGETVPGIISVVFFALLFCFVIRRTGNLWWAVGFHTGWDWGQTFFYGVPDSGAAARYNLFNSAFHGSRWITGGTVGPEASIFTPLTLLLVVVIVASFYRENRYPVG